MSGTYIKKVILHWKLGLLVFTLGAMCSGAVLYWGLVVPGSKSLESIRSSQQSERQELRECLTADNQTRGINQQLRNIITILQKYDKDSATNSHN